MKEYAYIQGILKKSLAIQKCVINMFEALNVDLESKIVYTSHKHENICIHTMMRNIEKEPCNSKMCNVGCNKKYKKM